MTPQDVAGMTNSEYHAFWRWLETVERERERQRRRQERAVRKGSR